MAKTNTPTLQDVAARQRWTAEDARQVLAAQADGETQERLAERLNLDPVRLSRWRSKLARLDATESATTKATPRRSDRSHKISFTDAGAMTLGRQRPPVIIEVTDECLRVEVWDPSSIGACVAALRSRGAR